MKILLVGDTHGDENQIRRYLQPKIDHLQPDCVFQLGDFGYKFESSFIKAVQSLEIPFYWLDGNHDNHDFLEESGALNDPSGFHELWDGIFYSPRGHSFTWEGTKFLTVGGAWSIDYRHRTLHYSLWPQEMIRKRDEDAALLAGKVDVMLTHDAPNSPALTRILENFGGFYPRSNANRGSLDRIVEATRPSMLFHGHYHVNYESHHSTGTSIKGLDCDGMGDSAIYFLEI